MKPRRQRISRESARSAPARSVSRESQDRLRGTLPTTMNALCSECGAPLEGRVTESGLVTCRYCGHGHDVRALAAQGRRTLISAADFSGTEVRGWHTGPRLRGQPTGRTPPAWSISMENDGQNHPLLWAPGSFDDFDVSFAVRFVAGSAGDAVYVKARGASAGAVTLHLWKEGALTLGWQQPDHVWQPNVVTARPVKPLAPDAWWRARWTAVGARHKAYLNGALVLAATHEPIRHSGHIDLRLRVSAGPMTVEIAELALFEPPERV